MKKTYPHSVTNSWDTIWDVLKAIWNNYMDILGAPKIYSEL